MLQSCNDLIGALEGLVTETEKTVAEARRPKEPPVFPFEICTGETCWTWAEAEHNFGMLGLQHLRYAPQACNWRELRQAKYNEKESQQLYEDMLADAVRLLRISSLCVQFCDSLAVSRFMQLPAECKLPAPVLSARLRLHKTLNPFLLAIYFKLP